MDFQQEFRYATGTIYNVSQFLELKQCIRNFQHFIHKVETFNTPITKDSEYVDHILEMFRGSEPNLITKNFCKSLTRAKELRKEGNRKYANKEFCGACKLYTKSIMYAVNGTEDLGLAYANRSAVLFEKGYYKECLEDIERALQNKYPEDKKEKLDQRREKATIEIQSTKKVLYHTALPNLPNINAEIPSASASIKIQKSADGTQHIIAKNKIKAGDIILIENPFVTVGWCYRTVRYIHCNECMELCYNMIPCNKCPFALYCSIKCRRDAFVKYHRYECPLLQLFGYSVPHSLFLRLTLLALKEYTNAPNSSTDNIIRSNEYKNIHNNLSAKLNHFSPEVRLKLAIIPTLFYRVLAKTELLLEYDFEDKHTVFKELLVKNALLCVINSRHIEKFRSPTGTEPVGTGIFTVFNFFNHSCAHNVDATFYGTTLVLYARRNIKMGEECFVNFGCSYIDMNKTLRSQLLKASFTKCSCKACTNNWPTRLELMARDFSVCKVILDLNKEFDSGKITNKRKFLADCCRYFSDLNEVEWSLNKMILNIMITKCIYSMGNNNVEF